MGIVSPIEYCDSTLNLMMGCDGCELWNPEQGVKVCYAGVLTGRYGGPGKLGWPDSFDQPKLFTHRLTAALKWPDLTGKNRPMKPWLNGYPRVIFHGDLGDYWTESLPIDWLAPHVEALANSPHIHLFLTKRSNRMLQFWTAHMGQKTLPSNFWFLTTITTVEKLWRIKYLQYMRDLGATVLGVSYEPAWEAVDFSRYDLNWIIAGGQSSAGGNDMNLGWLRAPLEQRERTGTAWFVKQTGTRPLVDYYEKDDETREWALSGNHTVLEADGSEWLGGYQPHGGSLIQIRMADRKGGDMEQWPEWLRVRQMPGEVYQ